ncbi:hypothetical protein Vadar_006029 [Vaccinium darrowii]|uniref:Uncharacterized protein n=1 Tax=Vaccinium darrowii TaxID=229202 RepID=A0ACB7XFT5_9ERIC|nr:hypothetical protein Vadar_006029 [Vaccinium darrowii]
MAEGTRSQDFKRLEETVNQMKTNSEIQAAAIERQTETFERQTAVVNEVRNLVAALAMKYDQLAIQVAHLPSSSIHGTPHPAMSNGGSGRYASKEEAKKKGNVINCVGWWFKPWFYQHAQTALKKGEFVEYIPTREYYHRHTRCLYWEGKLILPFGDQWWFRFLLGWMMPPKVSLLKATQGEAIGNYYPEMHVIQDMLVPLYKVGDALEFVHKEMEVYPLWLCPHKLFKLPYKTMVYPEAGFELHRRQGDTHYAQMYTDVGVYYTPGPVLRGEVFDGVEAVRNLETWLIENHGYQPQYAVSELDEKKFWRMFDAGLYENCRKKYGAVGTFMSVYYKSKKGRKTEKEVQEAEQEQLETPIAEVDDDDDDDDDQPAD